MENKPIIVPSLDDLDTLKAKKNKEHEEEEELLRFGSALQKLETMIETHETEKVRLNNKIDFLEGRFRSGKEATEKDLEDSREELKRNEESYKNLLEIKELCQKNWSETILRKADYSGKVEEIENKIEDFKNELLHYPRITGRSEN